MIDPLLRTARRYLITDNRVFPGGRLYKVDQRLQGTAHILPPFFRGEGLPQGVSAIIPAQLLRMLRLPPFGTIQIDPGQDIGLLAGGGDTGQILRDLIKVVAAGATEKTAAEGPQSAVTVDPLSPA